MLNTNVLHSTMGIVMLLISFATMCWLRCNTVHIFSVVLNDIMHLLVMLLLLDVTIEPRIDFNMSTLLKVCHVEQEDSTSRW